MCLDFLLPMFPVAHDRACTKDLPLRSEAVEPAPTLAGRAPESAGRRVLAQARSR